MIDERRTFQASRYLLGTLSADERRDFEAAMRADPRLQLLVDQLRGTGGRRDSAPDPPAPVRTVPDPEASVRNESITQAPITPGASAPSPSRETPGWILWTPWLLSACFAVLSAVLISSFIASARIAREKTVEFRGQLEQKRREVADLQRQTSQLDIAAAETSTNYQRRIRELEAKLLKDVEQLGQQSATLTSQLRQQLSATNRELVAVRTKLEQLARANKALEDAVASLGSRERDRFSVVRLVALKPEPGHPYGALGAAFWSPNDQRGVLAVENLPVLSATQAYQLWLTDTKASAPISGGLLPVNSGSLRVQFTTDRRIETLQRVFITIESVLGAATPAGRTVLSGN